MAGIINAFKWIIETIKTTFSILMTIFQTITMAFNYLLQIVNITLNLIATLPTFIRAFALITLAISVTYFIIGRNAGKSD